MIAGIWRGGFSCFNTQPPEGGWVFKACSVSASSPFQHTAARRRLGRFKFARTCRDRAVSTHSRPKAAGCGCAHGFCDGIVSTHSRPKAAGRYRRRRDGKNRVSTHSRPKAAGWRNTSAKPTHAVSTHSRPKAAGLSVFLIDKDEKCFNTQPPEGGWCLSQKPCSIRFRSPNFAKLLRKAQTRV